MKHALISLLLCEVLVPSLHGQDASALLEKSRQATTLELPSNPSFHLRAEFHTFDYKGVPDGDGTIDEIFERGGRWKRSIEYRGQQKTEVFPNTGMTLVKGALDFEPSFAEADIVRMLLAPVPSAMEIKSKLLSLTPLKLGSINLVCVVAALPSKSESNSKATAPNEAYCIAPETGLVRSIQAHNGRMSTLNNFVRIGSLYFAQDIATAERGKPRANLHVTKIEPLPSVAADEFSLQGASAEHNGLLSMPASIVVGKMIHKVDPVYPDSARRARVQGTVVLRGLIGKLGTIIDLELVSTPDDALAVAAMDAVRNWTYQPFLSDDKPIIVDTQITVNFAFR